MPRKERFPLGRVYLSIQNLFRGSVPYEQIKVCNWLSTRTPINIEPFVDTASQLRTLDLIDLLKSRGFILQEVSHLCYNFHNYIIEAEHDMPILGTDNFSESGKWHPHNHLKIATREVEKSTVCLQKAGDDTSKKRGYQSASTHVTLHAEFCHCNPGKVL